MIIDGSLGDRTDEGFDMSLTRADVNRRDEDGGKDEDQI